MFVGTGGLISKGIASRGKFQGELINFTVQTLVKHFSCAWVSW